MAGDRLRIVMSWIMRRRSGLNPTISLLLFSRLRFNSRNPSKQKRHPQTDSPNAAIAASFNPNFPIFQTASDDIKERPPAMKDGR
ncbi:hypothetical protein NKJ46_31480 [Mesorhizobium sp. M0166]|uniref:hypothetical protein n=1 Tax=Mesorhizobium sp. M0166 TaxID=2956902 RepID=UPI00333B729D